MGETRGLLELPRLALRFPELAMKPRGSGQAVLVIPGYRASDASTAVLQTYLSWLGYRPYGWGLGRNRGNPRALLPRVAARLREITSRSEAPIALIGWSLGGYLAREVAREDPERVEQVVTLGAPVFGGQPVDRPVTAIFSKSDRVVDWRACIDRRSPDVEHIEVATTHVGLGFSPEVYGIVAERLASPGPHGRDHFEDT